MIASHFKSPDDNNLIVITDDLQAGIEKLGCGGQYFKIAYNVSWGHIVYETKAVVVQGAVFAVSSKKRKCRWEGTSLPGEGRFFYSHRNLLTSMTGLKYLIYPHFTMKTLIRFFI